MVAARSGDVVDQDCLAARVTVAIKSEAGDPVRAVCRIASAAFFVRVIEIDEAICGEGRVDGEPEQTHLARCAHISREIQDWLCITGPIPAIKNASLRRD